MEKEAKKTPNNKITPEGELFLEYIKHSQAGELNSALDVLTQLYDLVNESLKALVCQFIAETLQQLNRPQDALAAAEDGLRFPGVSSQLYKIHAELLYAQGQDRGDLTRALNSIDQAINLYDQDIQNEKLATELKTPELIKWVTEKTKSRTEMAALKVSIEGLQNSLTVFERIQDIEANIDKEKVKTIELMAIFTAILALIFANVQFSTSLGVKEIIVANISLVVAVTWMVWVVQAVTKERGIFSFVKRPWLAWLVLTGVVALAAYLVGKGLITI